MARPARVTKPKAHRGQRGCEYGEGESYPPFLLNWGDVFFHHKRKAITPPLNASDSTTRHQFRSTGMDWTDQVLLASQVWAGVQNSILLKTTSLLSSLRFQHVPLCTRSSREQRDNRFPSQPVTRIKCLQSWFCFPLIAVHRRLFCMPPCACLWAFWAQPFARTTPETSLEMLRECLDPHRKIRFKGLRWLFSYNLNPPSVFFESRQSLRPRMSDPQNGLVENSSVGDLKAEHPNQQSNLRNLACACVCASK